MEFVLVSHPQNANDPIYQFGFVPYIYEIAKFPITNEEYAAFLNAVAKYDDPFSLYNPSMNTGLFGGINQLNDGDRRIYKPKQDWEKKPVVYISWYDTARMANWLHYGKPDTGRSEMGTTEGDASNGAYNTSCFPNKVEDLVDYSKLPITRNKNALYWIPNEDEWYKAAHYDPEKKDKRKYWDYPTRTDSIPNNNPPPGDPYSVNFFNVTFSVGKPHFLTDVGAYKFAASYYGTFDQGGNVWEWLENWRFADRGVERVRGLRGGSATYSEVGLHARNTDPGNPSHEKFVWGGRLARAHVTDQGKIIFSDTSYAVYRWYLKQCKKFLRRKIKGIKELIFLKRKDFPTI